MKIPHQLPMIITDTFVSVYFNDRTVTISSHDTRFASILEAIKKKDFENVKRIADNSLVFEQPELKHSGIRLDFETESVFYKDHKIQNSVVKRIFSINKLGLNFEPLVKFLENLLDNPSKTAVDELYLFLETGNMPITEDGCFLAYKKVRSDYKDIYSRTYDNSVGSVVEVERNSVSDNRHDVCSYGLHFCSLEYLKHYSGVEGNRTMVLKINPKDVVSIPSDYNNTKGRCCRYEVYDEVKNEVSEINKPTYFNDNTPVVPSIQHTKEQPSVLQEHEFVNMLWKYSSGSELMEIMFKLFGTPKVLRLRNKRITAKRILHNIKINKRYSKFPTDAAEIISRNNNRLSHTDILAFLKDLMNDHYEKY